MKIGIDGRIFSKPGSGIVRYSFELVQYLIKKHPEHTYIIYVYKNGDYKSKIKFKGSYVISTVNLNPLLWRTKVFTDFLDKEKLDIFYITHPEVPYVSSSQRNVRIISTCHGVIPNNLWPSLKERLWCQPLLYAMAKYSDHIICVSEDTRKAIHNTYKRDLDTMSVGYFGLSPLMKPLSKQAKIKALRYLAKKYGIPNKEFIFQVGGEQPYKNVLTILKTSKLLNEKHNLTIPLVIARVSSNTVLDCELLKHRIEMLGLDKADIIPIQWIDFEDIPLLYACAKINIYPSLFEGVGFPIAEAFACASPVITTNISAMPECAGGAALLIQKPLDEYEWANKIYELYNNKQLQKKLIKLGLERAKDFTWSKTGTAVLRSFNKTIIDKGFND